MRGIRKERDIAKGIEGRTRDDYEFLKKAKSGFNRKMSLLVLRKIDMEIGSKRK